VADGLGRMEADFNSAETAGRAVAEAVVPVKFRSPRSCQRM
jgi:hypothetical protein